MVLPERVHNLVGTGASIVDVAEDMQLVDGQPLDHVADRADEVVCPSCRDDGVYDDGYVGGLVLVVGTLMQQFLNDVREVYGQRLAHF